MPSPYLTSVPALTRPHHGDPAHDSSATDSTVIVGAISTAVESIAQEVVDGRSRVTDLASFFAANGGAYDGTTDCAAALRAALTFLTNGSGHLSGELRITGPAALASTVTISGGYGDTSNTLVGQTSAGVESFALNMANGSFVCAAGIGRAISVQDLYDPDIHIRFINGGQLLKPTDVAVTGTAMSSVSTGASFRAGQRVMIYGAGTAAGSVARPFVTYIVSVASNIATLNESVPVNVTGATAIITDVGLHVENVFGGTFAIHADDHAGTVLQADPPGGNHNKRWRCSHVRELIANNCGQALSFKYVEAWGQFGLIIDNGSTVGSYFGQGADTGWRHFEGGNAVAAVQDSALWLDNMNNMNVGTTSLGGACGEAFVVVDGGSVGNFDGIRLSANPGGTLFGTENGIKFRNVSSMSINTLRTFRHGGTGCAGAIFVDSSVNIKRHHSTTGDAWAAIIDGGSGAGGDGTVTTPVVDVTLDAHFTGNTPIKITTNALTTLLKLSGHWDATVNQTGASSLHLIESAQSTACVIELTRFTSMRTSNVSSTFTNHTGEVRGLQNAYLANGVKAKGTIWVSDGSGGMVATSPGSNGQIPTWDGSGNIIAASPATFIPPLTGVYFTCDPRTAIAGAAYAGSRIYGVRVTIPVTGHITSIAFLLVTSAASENFDLGVLDTTVTTRNRLDSGPGGVITGVALPNVASTATWVGCGSGLQFAAPSIAVTAGQQCDLFLGLDNTTATIARAASTGIPPLPTGLMTASGGASPKVSWVYTTSYRMTSTVAESALNQGGVTPLIVYGIT